MQKIISAAFLCTALVFFSAMASDDKARSFQSWHKDLSNQCIKCHEQKKPIVASGAFKCEKCHETAEDMVKETKGLGIRNPHHSIHYGTSLPCEECHKEHSEPYNYCTEACHRTWPNTIPRAGR